MVCVCVCMCCVVLIAVDIWNTRRRTSRRWRLNLDACLSTLFGMSLACIVVCYIEEKIHVARPWRLLNYISCYLVSYLFTFYCDCRMIKWCRDFLSSSRIYAVRLAVSIQLYPHWMDTVIIVVTCCWDDSLFRKVVVWKCRLYSKLNDNHVWC